MTNHDHQISVPSGVDDAELRRRLVGRRNSIYVQKKYAVKIGGQRIQLIARTQKRRSAGGSDSDSVPVPVPVPVIMSGGDTVSSDIRTASDLLSARGEAI